MLDWLKAKVFGAKAPTPLPVSTPTPLVKPGNRFAALVALSEKFEGFKTTPYQDGGGVWTIGIGSTTDADGARVTGRTRPVTYEQAGTMHVRDLAIAASRVKTAGLDDLPERWWAVAVSMSNNMGFMSVWGPTLLTLLKSKRWVEAADQMKHYRNIKGVGPSLGLRRRRWIEAAFALGIPVNRAYDLAYAQIHTADDWPDFPTGA